MAGGDTGGVKGTRCLVRSVHVCAECSCFVTKANGRILSESVL